MVFCKYIIILNILTISLFLDYSEGTKERSRCFVNLEYLSECMSAEIFSFLKIYVNNKNETFEILGISLPRIIQPKYFPSQIWHVCF